MTSADKLQGFDRLALGLIRHAARRAPGDLAARLEEEWLAGLADVRGVLARLRFALGCCWATTVITREQRFAVAPVASAAGHGVFGAYMADKAPGFSRRSVALLVVGLLHIGVFYAFTYGMNPGDLKPPKAMPPIDYRVIDPIPPPRTKVDVLMPQPVRDTFTVARPKPEPVAPPPSDPVIAEPATEMPPDGAAGAAMTPTLPPVPAVTRQHGGPGANFPNTADYYPSQSVRLEEQGAAAVEACVDRKGRLTGEPTIMTSSGFKRLDEAALRLAKAGSGHYRASLENGQPVDSCYPFKVVFSLNR